MDAHLSWSKTEGCPVNVSEYTCPELPNIRIVTGNVHGDNVVGKWVVYRGNDGIGGFSTIEEAKSFVKLKFKPKPTTVSSVRRYWVVINRTERWGGTLPCDLYRHPTPESAKGEAIRLSKCHRDSEFVVMMLTGIYKNGDSFAVLS